MILKIICCVLLFVGILFKFAGIFVFVAGSSSTLHLSSGERLGLGLSLLLFGMILFLISVILLIHRIRRERIDRARSHKGNSISGPLSGNGLVAETSLNPNAGAANAAIASQGPDTQHAELHEMTEVAAANGDTLRPGGPPAQTPPSQPVPALQEAIDLRGRSPLGLYPPMRYSSSESRNSKDRGEVCQESNRISSLKSVAESSTPKFPEPVMARHVRFAEPVAPPKVTASLASSKEPFESVSLTSPHYDGSVANKLSFHNYKVENGNITDLETGQLVDADQLHSPPKALGNPDLASEERERTFGVARSAQHTFTVGDGMFLDYSSLESAILRGGGSLKAGLNSEVSKGREFLKAWKSSASMRALLRNPGRGGKVSEVEFV